MEGKTGAILALQCIDKREAGGKSPQMEVLGFRKALKTVYDAGLKVTEVTTDAHIQIKSIMSKYLSSSLSNVLNKVNLI